MSLVHRAIVPASRGAGHGSLALVAEIIAGQLARRLGLRTPELALVWLDPRIAASEPDQEIQDLLRDSEGLNLAVDFLPGSAGFDPLGWTAGEEFASELLWSAKSADPAKPFDARHVLRGRATRLAEAHGKLAPLLSALTGGC